jgi:hypothetical protein
MNCSLAAALAVTLSLPAAAAGAATAKVSGGVEVPEELTVGSAVVRHNGSGVRKKFVVDVYVGSLYLVARSEDAETIVVADEPKAVRLHFLRDVSKEQMLDAFRDGFRANSPELAAPLEPKLAELARALPGTMKEGAILLVAYAPGVGTTVKADGGGEATIAGKEFADALFRNWLGRSPADGNLKKKMLGR